MTRYLDSSVVLRIVLGARGSLDNWKSIDHAVSSALTEVECLRTLDRLHLVDRIPSDEIASRREAVYALLSRVDVVEISRAVLARASQPLPVALKTLDAIHLASAMLWRETEQVEIEVATHDEALGSAARAMGFSVAGLSGSA